MGIFKCTECGWNRKDNKGGQKIEAQCLGDCMEVTVMEKI